MKASPKVIEELNKALREELAAINQYYERYLTMQIGEGEED